MTRHFFRPQKKRVSGLRRSTMLLSVLPLVLAAFSLTGPPAHAVGGTSPAAATPITSLPFSNLEYIPPSETRTPATAATGAHAAALSSRCNGGQPVYHLRWFSFASTTATSIIARGQLNHVLGRDHSPLSHGVAVLRAGTTEVLDCSVDLDPYTGSVPVAAGTRVLIAHFAVGGECTEFCWGLEEAEKYLRVIPGKSQPANDDWRNAKVITSLPFTQTVDTTVATQQPEDWASTTSMCEFTIYSNPPIRTVWWSFTPATTGPLNIAVNGTPIQNAERSRVPSVAKLTAAGPEIIDVCSATFPLVFQAGTTYLIQVGDLQDSWDFDATASAGGPATLSVTGGITLRKGPDLVVTAVSWSPSAPVAGTPVRFRATIKNQGAVATQGGTTHGVLFKVNGVAATFADSWDASLAPGASVTLTANGGPAGETWAARAGTHTVQATVDDVNRLPGEASETNNSRTRTMTVGAAAGKADLVVTKVTATPASPTVGAPVRFSATIKNQGTAATPNGVAHRVLFKVDGVSKTWSDTRTASLAAGASVTLTANAGGTSGTWPATSGPHTVQAVVDDLKRIGEQSEANNTRDVQVSVGAVVNRPDLVVTGLTWSPSLVTGTKAVRFSATIKNQGKMTTRSLVHGVGFRINGSPVAFSDNTTAPLHPGESRRVTANGGPTGGTWTARAGTHTLSAHVDDINRLPGEANEGNNVMSRVLVVP